MLKRNKIEYYAFFKKKFQKKNRNKKNEIKYYASLKKISQEKNRNKRQLTFDRTTFHEKFLTSSTNFPEKSSSLK